MFTIRVDRSVNDIRLAQLPIGTFCDLADIKCTNRNLSIIILPTPYSFVAVLRMLPAFFTSFQFHPVGEYNAYRVNFYLKFFTTYISNVYSNDLSVTLLLNRHNALTPINFEDRDSGYLQYSPLLLARPHNLDINPIDLGVSLAIHLAEFIKILPDLMMLPTEYVCLVVTKMGALFKSTRKEIVFSTQINKCIMEGIGEGQRNKNVFDPTGSIGHAEPRSFPNHPYLDVPRRRRSQRPRRWKPPPPLLFPPPPPPPPPPSPPPPSPPPPPPLYVCKCFQTDCQSHRCGCKDRGQPCSIGCFCHGDVYVCHSPFTR